VDSKQSIHRGYTHDFWCQIEYEGREYIQINISRWSDPEYCTSFCCSKRINGHFCQYRVQQKTWPYSAFITVKIGVEIIFLITAVIFPCIYFVHGGIEEVHLPFTFCVCVPAYLMLIIKYSDIQSYRKDNAQGGNIINSPSISNLLMYSLWGSSIRVNIMY
jgi:hypothetical protein